MSSFVLDSSALLAALFAEAGADIVAAEGHAGIISAVNYSEVLTKTIDRGAPQQTAEALLASFSLAVIPFDARQAAIAASFRKTTRAIGLSLGDRACLALASLRKLPAMTADRDWATLEVGVQIELIR